MEQMPSLHTNISITFVLRLFLLLFVTPLVAFSSHTDKLRLEFRQDIHQISLAVDHLIDVFIDFRRFVQGSRVWQNLVNKKLSTL